MLKVAIDQLALVGVINVDMREQATLLTASVGREISSMIDRQAELGARFEELIAQQHQLRKDGNANRQTVRHSAQTPDGTFAAARRGGLDGVAARLLGHAKHGVLAASPRTRARAHSPDPQEVASEIKLVGEQLRSSISTLCGKLKGNPNVAENLAKISGERQLLQTLLHAALDELESTRQLGGILAMVQSEKSRHKEIQDMVEREKAAARAVVTLRLELSDEQEQHDKVGAALDMQRRCVRYPRGSRALSARDGDASATSVVWTATARCRRCDGTRPPSPRLRTRCAGATSTATCKSAMSSAPSPASTAATRR